MRPEIPGIGHEFVEANGMRFSVATAGEGDRLALCLHGFPECWYSWKHQVPMLVRRGYRVWAPDLRGYGASSKPPRVDDYAFEPLLDDIAGLIDTSGAKETTLLAHDWGGVLAWWFAMRKLRALERLVIFNAPHMIAARQQMSWRQRIRSAYVLFFQIPGLPERMLGGEDAHNIPRMMLRAAGRPEAFSREDLEVYRASAAQPGALTAMLNYYRAMPGSIRRAMTRENPPIEVPTLLLWGTTDTAIGYELTHGMAPYATNLTTRYLPGVGHWSQQEAPEEANRLLGAWLDGEPVPFLPGDERFREPADAAAGDR